MKKLKLFIASLILLLNYGMAANNGIKMEEPDEKSHYRPKGYIGVLAGNYAMVVDEDNLFNDNMAKIGLEIGYRFTSTSSLYGDVNFMVPDGGWGFLLGYQQDFFATQVAPFVGIGVGSIYLFNTPERDLDFSSRYCLNGNINAGVHLLRLENMNVRVRANYDVLINKQIEQSIGADLSFIFFFGGTKIKEINVN